MSLDFLRHGETGMTGFRGRTDDLLTDIGWQQMRAAVAHAAQTAAPWQEVVSSPLRRCADFAREFAEKHHLPLSFDDRLRELDFGQWEGRSADEVPPQQLTRFWADPWEFTPADGEPLVDFEKRVCAVWSDLNRHTHSTLVVTHGGVIRMLLYRALAADKKIGKNQLLRIEVPHASLHRIP